MKKTFIALTLAALGGTAAADSYFGIYTYGVQYTIDNGANATRIGLGIPFFFFTDFGVNGNVSYLLPGGSIGGDANLSYHYGAGADLGVYGGTLALRPNVLATLDYRFNNNLSGFVEANVGPQFFFGNGRGISPVTFDTKIGLNFR
ncbi:hypothetical protein [Deinococcus pimensis]|uniref:hypothetical protein n=1 Tax=Deinococcus pimensis TaxID=309888 RepID=UPI00048583B4|nr:hypothetical protein [Deinococcus pimensis]